MRAAVLGTAVRTLGQGVVARARALATSGPSSQSAPRTAMSAWGPAEEVDEGVERHGADWQGIKEPYQLELMPSMDAIRPWGHHAIRMKDAFWPWMAASCWTIQMPIWRRRLFHSCAARRPTLSRGDQLLSHGGGLCGRSREDTLKATFT